MNRRHYPPGVVFHAPDCTELKNADVQIGRADAMRILDAIVAFPSNRYCPGCTGGGPDNTPYVAIEDVDYGPHDYTPLAGEPPRDAIRPLCSRCRGTHDETSSPQQDTPRLIRVPGTTWPQ